jgi:hypothetical protein
LIGEEVPPGNRIGAVVNRKSQRFKRSHVAASSVSAGQSRIGMPIETSMIMCIAEVKRSLGYGSFSMQSPP